MVCFYIITESSLQFTVLLVISWFLVYLLFNTIYFYFHSTDLDYINDVKVESVYWACQNYPSDIYERDRCIDRSC